MRGQKTSTPTDMATAAMIRATAARKAHRGCSNSPPYCNDASTIRPADDPFRLAEIIAGLHAPFS
jgi:hypothetical protein